MTQQNLAHAPDGANPDSPEKGLLPNDALTRVAETGILPVIAIPSLEAAVPLADALVAGGVRAIEVTLRNPWALEAIAAIRAAHPDMAIGAGTVLSEGQVAAARQAGADFLVSPGFDPEIVRAAQAAGLPIVPGVVNPTQVTAAVKMGLKVLKFFPAEQSGGIPALTLLHGPFPDVSFVPTGGLTLANLGAYLDKPFVAACGGSYMAKTADIVAGNWTKITELCRQWFEVSYEIPADMFLADKDMVLTNYVLEVTANWANYQTRVPKTWSLEAFADDRWIALDRRSEATWETEPFTYGTTDYTAYRAAFEIAEGKRFSATKYRLRVKSLAGASDFQLSEVTFNGVWGTGIANPPPERKGFAIIVR